MNNPQQPGPYGQHPRQPGPYGHGVPQHPQSGQPGAHQQGSPPPPKKTRLIVGVSASAVVVLVAGFAWPGWFTGDDSRSATHTAATSTAVADEPEDLSTPETAAKAVVQRLNRKDVRGLVRDLTCAAGKEMGRDGVTALAEEDLRSDLPTFDPKSRQAVREVRTQFDLVEIDRTAPARPGADEKDRLEAVVSVRYLDVPEEAKDVLKDHEGHVELVEEEGEWLVCGMSLDGAETARLRAPSSSGAPSSPTAPSGSAAAEGNDPNAVLEAYVAAVNRKDQTGAVKLVCMSATKVRDFTRTVVDAGAQLHVDQRATPTDSGGTSSSFRVAVTSGGEAATYLGSTSRTDAGAPWCLSALSPSR